MLTFIHATFAPLTIILYQEPQLLLIHFLPNPKGKFLGPSFFDCLTNFRKKIYQSEIPKEMGKNNKLYENISKDDFKNDDNLKMKEIS